MLSLRPELDDEPLYDDEDEDEDDDRLPPIQQVGSRLSNSKSSKTPSPQMIFFFQEKGDGEKLFESRSDLRDDDDDDDRRRRRPDSRLSLRSHER